MEANKQEPVKFQVIVLDAVQQFNYCSTPITERESLDLEASILHFYEMVRPEQVVIVRMPVSQ